MQGLPGRFVFHQRGGCGDSDDPMPSIHLKLVAFFSHIGNFLEIDMAHLLTGFIKSRGIGKHDAYQLRFTRINTRGWRRKNE